MSTQVSTIHVADSVVIANFVHSKILVSSKSVYALVLWDVGSSGSSGAFPLISFDGRLKENFWNP